jgi:hypothetical protein
MQRLKLDYRLTEAVSAELENPDWPVRLIAVFILAKSQDENFLPVLSWIAKNDQHPMVKQLAAILSGNVEPEYVKHASSERPVVSEVEPSREAEPNTNDVNQPTEKEADNITPARDEPVYPGRGRGVEPNSNNINQQVKQEATRELPVKKEEN